MRVFKITCIIGLLLLNAVSVSATETMAKPNASETTVAGTAEEKVRAGTNLSDPNMAGNLIQTSLGLLLVLAVIALAAWAFKRFGNVQVGAQGRMKVIGGISLGTRERAVLLQVGDQQLVIGVAPGRVQTLHVLDAPVMAEEKTDSSMSFATRLQTAITNRKPASNDEGAS